MDVADEALWLYIQELTFYRDRSGNRLHTYWLSSPSSYGPEFYAAVEEALEAGILQPRSVWLTDGTLYSTVLDDRTLAYCNARPNAVVVFIAAE